MDLSSVNRLLGAAAQAAGKAQQVALMVDAGLELAAVVRANVEEAAATLSETDAAKLRARAGELAQTNRALSEQLDALLKG